MYLPPWVVMVHPLFTQTLWVLTKVWSGCKLSHVKSRSIFTPQISKRVPTCHEPWLTFKTHKLHIKQVISYDQVTKQLGWQTLPSDLNLVKICCSGLCNRVLGMAPGRMVRLAVEFWFSPCWHQSIILGRTREWYMLEKNPLTPTRWKKLQPVDVALGVTRMQTGISTVFQDLI